MNEFPYASAESIKQANAQERDVRYANRTDWDTTDLMRHALPGDANESDAGFVVRITYACAGDRYKPDNDSDFYTLHDASNASLRDAQDISAHEGVYGVAAYLVERATAEMQETPLVIFQNGLPVAIS